MGKGRWLIAFVILLTSLLAGCGGDGNVQASDQKIDDTYKPAPSLEDAVEAVLGAMQRNANEESFALLTPNSRNEYKDLSEWIERQRELPAITGYKLEGEKDLTRIALVDHEPGLSPFVGLIPSQERQTWTGEKFDGGWLVNADPTTEPILPPDDDAPAVAKQWLEAVQACDQAKASSMQGVSTLFTSVTPTICRVEGAVVVGTPEDLPEGSASTDIVAQYTPDALEWARAVPVTSPLVVKVILAPIGDQWKVIGLT